MILYLRMFWASVRSVEPMPYMTIGEAVAQSVLLVLGNLSVLFSIASLFVAALLTWVWCIVSLLLLGLSLHIETKARIETITHICGPDCE